MHPNGDVGREKSIPSAPRVVYSSDPKNQYTVRLAAVKRNPNQPAPTPIHTPRADNVQTFARSEPLTYRVPVAHGQSAHISQQAPTPPRTRRIGTFIRWTTVTLGTLIFSTLAINAIDNLDKPEYSMLGAVFHAYNETSGGGPCPTGMAYVDTSAGGFCIDMYEASAGSECIHKKPGNAGQTDANLSMQTCKPESVAEGVPWVFVSRQQAELACAHAGKRLPSTTEWYRAALGTPDTDTVPGHDECNTEGNTSDKTGTHTKCISPAGAFDMVGNVWEWQQETVTDGTLNGRPLPVEGYVTSIDDSGVPLATDQSMPNPSFFSDYFAIDPTQTQGILRGGYWRSGTDSGVYGMNVTVPPSFQGNAVGFRCAKSAQK